MSPGRVSPLRFWQKAMFRVRERASALFVSPWRKLWWRGQGMHVGPKTRLPRLIVTWPHQVSIGGNCLIEDEVYFKYDGIWAPGPSLVISDGCFIGRGCEFNIRSSLVIGPDCLIASGCKFIDHDHGLGRDGPMKRQIGLEKGILLGRDVWLGANVMVLKGVTIADGGVVAAGAVLTKSVGPMEIWAGVPARKIGERP